MDEFELIRTYFAASRAAQEGRAVAHKQALGIGDDAAVLAPLPQGQQLVVTTDSLVENRHYFSSVNPRALGHKALAVSLSDLAAMGATPWAFTLNLHLRSVRRPWLEDFSQGMTELALVHGLSLVGGDTVSVQTEEAIVVTAMGLVPLGQALSRQGLQLHDDLWVSGSLGDGAWALQHQPTAKKLLWPEPRLALGQALREQGLAHAAIDISDGLASELGHLLSCSARHANSYGLVAHIELKALSQCLGPELHQAVQKKALSLEEACLLAARSGDEYELLFSSPADSQQRVLALAEQLGVRLTRLGRLTSAPPTLSSPAARSASPASLRPSASLPLSPSSIQWYGLDGRLLSLSEGALSGFNHFQQEGPNDP
jgi:thiamine-monophosphate kinase